MKKNTSVLNKLIRKGKRSPGSRHPQGRQAAAQGVQPDLQVFGGRISTVLADCTTVRKELALLPPSGRQCSLFLTQASA